MCTEISSSYTYKPISNPGFHSQAYLNYEYSLLFTNYRVKYGQCILRISFTNVASTITKILATVVGVAVLLHSVVLTQ